MIFTKKDRDLWLIVIASRLDASRLNAQNPKFWQSDIGFSGHFRWNVRLIKELNLLQTFSKFYRKQLKSQQFSFLK